jgi:hypothetical protein
VTYSCGHVCTHKRKASLHAFSVSAFEPITEPPVACRIPLDVTSPDSGLDTRRKAMPASAGILGS